MATNTVESEAGTEAEGTEAAVGHTSGTGLDSNVAGALSYLLGVVTGLAFFLIEREDAFVRFHAAQSMVVFGGIFLASVVLSVVGTVVTAVMFSGSAGGVFAGSVVSLVLGLVWLVVWLAALGLWLYLMVRTYQGNDPRIPVAAGIADRIVK